MSNFAKLSIPLVLLIAGSIVMAASDTNGDSTMFPALREYLHARRGEFDQIPTERQRELKKLALYVKSRIGANQPARLTFICTHNSRRSHMSQIWADTAARYFGIEGVETYSGGTEATAFNPRAVAAIERAGLRLEKLDETENPRYAVRCQEKEEALICFSKVYNENPNPGADFCAVMTCSQADKNCPIVEGSSLRIAIPYEDPKVADGTPEEADKYDERSRQICREMLFIFSQL